MFCQIPFTTIYVEHTLTGGVRVSPCCAAISYPASTIDFHNDKNLQRIRDESFRNIPSPECVQCINLEKNGFVSSREPAHYHEKPPAKLHTIDFFVGNICNLACAICGPDFSSVWQAELGQKQAFNNKQWAEIDLSTVEVIHFTGGEPLLSKEHIVFLESVPDKKKVGLIYNTNGTVFPTQNLINLWKQFKEVCLTVSVDDKLARFEYLRYPAKWDNFIENLQRLTRLNSELRLMIGFTTTVCWLNTDVDLSFLPSLIPPSMFTKHDFQLALGMLAVDRFNTNPYAVYTYLQEIDTRRGLSWEKTFPGKVDEMYERLKEQNGKN